MKTGFKDPLKKEQVSVKKAPWDFRAPPHDEAQSCYVNTGSHYGVGKNQPVGHSGNGSMTAPCLPDGRVSTLVTRPGSLKNLPIEIQE